VNGQELTQYHTVIAFDKTAELTGKYATKGRKVYVEGRLEYRSSKDRFGNEREAAEIIAGDVQFLGSKRDATAGSVGFSGRRGGGPIQSPFLMVKREGPRFFDERFGTLRVVQEALERRGYFLHPVAKEHTEGLVTGPLVHRLRTHINKRGFGNVADRVAITFSGYSQDEREVYDIPEVRAYWRALDAQPPELPALLAIIPKLRYNGPGMQLMLVGAIDAVRHRPSAGMYDVHAVEGPRLTADAVTRIRAAGLKCHLTAAASENLIEHFQRGAGVA
jgi:Single-strand binding protein family